MSELKLTKDEREKACNGELCPFCKGNDVKWVGSSPDFCGYQNNQYRCLTCKLGWEGY